MQSINKTLTLFTLLLINLTACVDPKAEQKKLQEEVMAVHDSLMMDMGKLSNSKEKLSLILTKLDSLKSTQAGLDTTILKNKIYDTKLALSKADDAMMDWMNGFNPDYTNKSEQEVEVYLKNQKTKIEEVKTLFKNSLSISDSIITKYQ
jgi:uncharacterized membrane protein YcgQ (UPF0703/DUF1980 family)